MEDCPDCTSPGSPAQRKGTAALQHAAVLEGGMCAKGKKKRKYKKVLCASVPKRCPVPGHHNRLRAQAMTVQRALPRASTATVEAGEGPQGRWTTGRNSGYRK